MQARLPSGMAVGRHAEWSSRSIPGPFWSTLWTADPSDPGGPEMTTVMPPVSECTVSGCSYNDHDHGCHAFAITVSGHDGSADCGTFIPLTVRGGLPRAEAQVGACQRTDCVHND